MQQLPKDIEEKLEKLEIIPFDGSEAFQRVILSDDFSDIFNYYRENYLPDVLKTKSEVQQRISLYLSLTNQDQDFLNQTNEVLYRRPVPTIEEFLSNNYYMGYLNSTLYPYWREQLGKLFTAGSPIRKAIFSGCIGCLTEDTVVATLNGNKTIGELLNNYKNEWVLSYNTANNTWEPDKIIDVFYSGHKDVYEIELDNGEKIQCTSNHRFLTRKNKWVSIDNGLVPGLSMMPYYTQTSKTGYAQVKNNKTEKFENRYVIVGKWKTDYWKGQHIHHKNFNKLDDRPNNLTVISHKLHWNYHAKLGAMRWKEYNASIAGDEFKELRHQKSIKGYLTKKASPNFKEMEKKRLRKWNEFLQDSERQSNCAKAAWKKDPEGMKQKSIKSIVSYNKSEQGRNTSRLQAENMRRLRAAKSEEELRIISLKVSLSSLRRFNKIEKYKATLNEIHKTEPWYNPVLGAKANHKLKATYNHKIKSIKYVGKKDVYDITTERNHNFALKAGIVAHNCGKSTVARKVFVYVLYRMLCVRYPRAVLGVDNDSTLASIIISMTLKQVYDTNLLPVVKLMEGMPCFQKVMSTRAFENFDLSNPKCPFPFTVEKSSGTIFFPDNIIVTCGSNQGHFTGYNVFNSFCDEINEKGVDEAIALLNTLDNRFSSRFAGSDLVFQSVVSSARSTNSPIGEYVRHLPKNDPSIVKFNPMLWEVKPDPNFKGDGTFFKVQVGNGTIPSKIITDPGELKAIAEDNYEPPTGCIVIDVPTVYKTRFELQLDQSIQDLAGIATEDNSLVFRDTSKIEDENLCPELLFQANLGDGVDLFQMLLDNTNLFEKNDLDGKYYLKRAPKAERYVHCDLSSTGDCDTGLSMGHKEYRLNKQTNEKETVYVLDFIMAVSAKTTIDLEAVEKFYQDLVVKGNVSINTISADQYQSEVIRQNWEKSGLFGKVSKESVDIKLEPYINASNLVTLGQVKCGKCNKLKNELETLIFHKGKVEKTTALKDMADALTGFIYNAQMNYYDTPLYDYEATNNPSSTEDYSNLISSNETITTLF